MYAVNQAQVQRLLALPSLQKAQAALWIQVRTRETSSMTVRLWAQVPILMVLSLSTSLAGLCILHHYRHCDPLAAGRISAPDQVGKVCPRQKCQTIQISL